MEGKEGAKHKKNQMHGMGMVRTVLLCGRVDRCFSFCVFVYLHAIHTMPFVMPYAMLMHLRGVR